MDIHLTPESQQFIEDQLHSGAYHSVSEVIEALIQARATSQATGNGSASIVSERTAKQREWVLQVVSECEALAGASPTDGFTNRDHDRILYGERS